VQGFYLKSYVLVIHVLELRVLWGCVQSRNVQGCLFDLLKNSFFFPDISRNFAVVWDEYWQ
jgi:hypothetical protein